MSYCLLSILSKLSPNFSKSNMNRQLYLRRIISNMRAVDYHAVSLY